MSETITFLINFDRIGRHDDPAPLTVDVVDGEPVIVCRQLVEAVRTYAAPMCAAIRIDAAVNKPFPRRGRPVRTLDLDGVTGFVLDGSRLIGRFIAEIAPDRLIGVGA